MLIFKKDRCIIMLTTYFISFVSFNISFSDRDNKYLSMILEPSILEFYQNLLLKD